MTASRIGKQASDHDQLQLNISYGNAPASQPTVVHAMRSHLPLIHSPVARLSAHCDGFAPANATLSPGLGQLMVEYPHVQTLDIHTRQAAPLK